MNQLDMIEANLLQTEDNWCCPTHIIQLFYFNSSVEELFLYKHFATTHHHTLLRKKTFGFLCTQSTTCFNKKKDVDLERQELE